jgi:DNA-binding transcriptional regulator YhcF (GntR family)
MRYRMKQDRPKDELNWIPNYMARVPLHMQLVKVVTGRINTRQLQPGDLLPPVPDLSIASRISPEIVREAYAELKRLGFIQLVHDKDYVRIC